MIGKQEILMYAAKYSLSANTIEKDYVINWILAGIANSKILHEKWIFKGGTCLKKCYFETYRFSEDLDFTIIDASHISRNFLMAEFRNISNWIYEESGIEIPVELMQFEEYKNPRGNISIAGKLSYNGPLQRRAHMSTIKLDLTNDELMVRQPVWKNVHHPYSDLHAEQLKILTYSIEEIFAEKLRALAERMRPRDLYDVINLHKDKRWNPNHKIVLDVLTKKYRFKNIAAPTLQSIESASTKADLMADWSNMLAHQIHSLKPSEYYWEQLPGLFAWLRGVETANSLNNSKTGGPTRT